MVFMGRDCGANLNQVKSGVRTLETFRADMKRFSAQCEDMESLVSDRDIGILRVQTKRLKDVFIPSPQRCLHCIATLLPQLAAERYKRFVGLLHHAIDKLTDVPTTVEEFDQSIQFLQDCMDKRDAYEIEYQLVCSYYETMDDFDVPVPPEELAAFQTLEPDFVAFKNATDVAESNKDEQTVTFGHELERQIEALNRQVVEIRTRARHEMVSNRHSEVAVVLAYTSQLVGEIAKMQQEAKSIENYQRLFNLPVYRFEELQAASEVIELKHGLWDSLRIWAQLTDRWADSHLEKLEVAELEERCAWCASVICPLTQTPAAFRRTPSFRLSC
jgi:dynein heavy chain